MRTAVPLACSQLSISYGRRLALDGFDLNLQQGEIRALIGPNGSGKSTALQALAGLIRPASGRVIVDGRSVEAMPRRELAQRLAYLPQQPSAPDEMTVAQLVRQGRFAHVGLFRSHGPQDEKAVRWALDSTGLGELAERSLTELSGGERQRAWISAALAQEAQILLLDEPTSFLDIGYQVEVLDLVHRLSRDRGVAIVMAIHDLNQAMAVCDRISLLDRGRLVFDGDPHALAGTSLIEQVFRVRGAFVSMAGDAPPHFNVELARCQHPGPRHGTVPPCRARHHGTGHDRRIKPPT